jgi:thymidylate kinase
MLAGQGAECIHLRERDVMDRFAAGDVPPAPGTPASAEEASPTAVAPVLLLDAVFAALNTTDVRWLVLRGDADALARGGDVDLLVDPDAMSRVDAALLPLGFAAVPSAGRGSHHFLLGYDDAARAWVRLDFTDRVEFGKHQGLPSKVGPELLARRIRVRDHYRLCAEDAFWHLLLHRLLGGRDLGSDDLVRLSQQEQVAGPLADLADEASRPATSSAELLDLVMRREWQHLDALRPMLVRTWRRNHLGPHVVAHVGNAADRVRHAARSVVRPTGISVAIIGPDGAGKTTLAEGLRTTLPFPSSYVYMGVWREYPWDRWLQCLPGARLIQRMLRLLIRSAQGRLQRARGRVVLLDRFTYDVLLPSPVLDRRGRITVALVRRVGTEPQLVLVLDAPAEIMFARKGEQGIEELERRRLSYLDVARVRDDSAVIDATQPVEAVREEAQRVVWARLRRHWSRST